VGAFIAGDAIDPEDVAACVHLHVERLGRRPEFDLGIVQPGIGGEAKAAKGHVDGVEETAPAADVVGEVGGYVAPSSLAVCSTKLAVHLKDAGGDGAVGGGQREQRGEEECGGCPSHYPRRVSARCLCSGVPSGVASSSKCYS